MCACIRFCGLDMLNIFIRQLQSFCTRLLQVACGWQNQIIFYEVYEAEGLAQPGVVEAKTHSEWPIRERWGGGGYRVGYMSACICIGCFVCQEGPQRALQHIKAPAARAAGNECSLSPHVNCTETIGRALGLQVACRLSTRIQMLSCAILLFMSPKLRPH